MHASYRKIFINSKRAYLNGFIFGVCDVRGCAMPRDIETVFSLSKIKFSFGVGDDGSAFIAIGGSFFVEDL